MRRRTQADIRVYSKDDRPKCAAEDEELVQVMLLRPFTVLFDLYKKSIERERACETDHWESTYVIRVVECYSIRLALDLLF